MPRPYRPADAVLGPTSRSQCPRRYPAAFRQWSRSIAIPYGQALLQPDRSHCYRSGVREKRRSAHRLPNRGAVGRGNALRAAGASGTRAPSRRCESRLAEDRSKAHLARYARLCVRNSIRNQLRWRRPPRRHAQPPLLRQPDPAARRPYRQTALFHLRKLAPDDRH